MKLSTLLKRGRRPTALGLDDAPFPRRDDEPGPVAVPLCGVVTGGTRFDGMLWSETERDGTDPNQVILRTVLDSKFATQLHVVLTDGITVGGASVLDLPLLAEGLGVPVIAVMRKRPNLRKFRQVMDLFPDAEERWRRVEAAGEIHAHAPYVFQCVGCTPETALAALEALTDRGHVPECLRLAHLIGSAVMLGQSGRRA